MIESVIADCWVGDCDWERPFGRCRLNLTGMTAGDADERSRRYREVARKLRRPTNEEIRETRRVQALLENNPNLADVRELLANEYSEAGRYIRSAQADAVRAFEQVKTAALLVLREDRKAARAIERAVEIEAQYHAYPTWSPLLRVFRRWADRLPELDPEVRALHESAFAIMGDEGVIEELEAAFAARVRRVAAGR